MCTVSQDQFDIARNPLLTEDIAGLVKGCAARGVVVVLGVEMMMTNTTMAKMLTKKLTKKELTSRVVAYFHSPIDEIC